MNKNQYLRTDLIEAWKRLVEHQSTIEDLTLLLDSLKGDDYLQEFDDVFAKVWNEARTNKPLMTKERKEAYVKEVEKLIAESKHQRVASPSQTTLGKFTRFRKIWYAAAAAALLGLLIPAARFFMKAKTEQIETQVQYVELFTERGDIKTLFLPDSTEVWLNAGSSIKYPNNFTEQRFVFLEGEAFFQVTHQASNPFTVHANGLEITVLGTIFNVAAYQNEAEIVTTLVDGKIALQLTGDPSQQTILSPDQQVVFNKNSRELTFSSVDTELYTSWVKGYFKFDNASFEQIAKKFERAYGLVIRFDDESLKKLQFTGAFLYDQPIETALGFLQKIRNFRYTVEENQIIIKY